MARTIFAAMYLLLATAMAKAALVEERPVELTGVITQVEGAVRLSGPGVAAVPLANPWQAIRGGVTVRIPEAGAAGIVCSNRRFVSIRGPATWSLTEPSCAAGKELAPADYLLIAPQAGRFNVIHGLLVLERFGDTNSVTSVDLLAPSIVSPPPDSVLRVPRPTVSWLQIPEAAEYQVEWISRCFGGFTTRLDASEVACAKLRDGRHVCSLPWPADRSGLMPGETLFLSVKAREIHGESWHSDRPMEVHTQSVASDGKLERHLGDLAVLGLKDAALDTARAGLLVREGRYADAAEAYQRALAAAPSPELRVTLADVENCVGNLRLAEPLYRQALGEGERAVRAAAAFGLGRLLFATCRDEEAAAAFRQAGELYAGLSLEKEEAMAEAAAVKAEFTLCIDPESENKP